MGLRLKVLYLCACAYYYTQSMFVFYSNTHTHYKKAHYTHTLRHDSDSLSLFSTEPTTFTDIKPTKSNKHQLQQLTKSNTGSTAYWVHTVLQIGFYKTNKTRDINNKLTQQTHTANISSNRQTQHMLEKFNPTLILLHS